MSLRIRGPTFAKVLIIVATFNRANLTLSCEARVGFVGDSERSLKLFSTRFFMTCQ